MKVLICDDEPLARDRLSRFIADMENFEVVAEEAYRISTELTTGARIAVLQDGEELSAWPLELIPDSPPEVVRRLRSCIRQR